MVVKLFRVQFCLVSLVRAVFGCCGHGATCNLENKRSSRKHALDLQIVLFVGSCCRRPHTEPRQEAFRHEPPEIPARARAPACTNGSRAQGTPRNTPDAGLHHIMMEFP